MASGDFLLCSTLSIENQVALSKALLGRHPTTVENSLGKGENNLQLMYASKGDKIFTLLEQMMDKELISEYNSCRVIYECSVRSLNTSALYITLGSTIDCLYSSGTTMTAASGSVIRFLNQSYSVTGTIVPNTCPAHLDASLPRGCFIIQLFRDAATSTYDNQLGYAMQARAGIEHVSKNVLVSMSAQERTRILTELWPQLPAEISNLIIKQLDARGLMTFARLSKVLYALVYSDDRLWQAVDRVPRAYSHGLKLANSHRKLILREAKKLKVPDVMMAFVIALGSHHMDAGIAGDEVPTVVSPSLLCHTGHFGQRKYYAGQEAALVANSSALPLLKDKQICNEEHLLYLIEHAFVAHSHICPDEQPLLLTTSARMQLSDKFLYECMERFAIPSIYRCQSEALALYGHGHTDGMVVDVGYECTTIIPIVEGYAVAADMRVLPTGGRHVTLELMKRIRAKYPALADLTEDEANHIKEQCCYLKTNGPFSHCYEGDQEVLIRGTKYHLGEELHQACEVLFRPLAFGLGTSDFKTLYSSSIESLEHNMPRPRTRNIVALIGATTLLPGYVQRFREEVGSLYANVRFSVLAMTERAYMPWIGGSILGSLSCHQNFWLSKEQLHHDSSERFPQQS